MSSHGAATEEEVPWREIVASERISEIRSRIAASGDPQAAAAELWETVTATPWWEPDPELAGAWRVTFLWRADPDLTRHVMLCGGIVFSAPYGIPFEQIPGTDVWHLTLRVPPGTRSEYVLSPNGFLIEPEVEPETVSDSMRVTATWVRDQRNPSTFVVPANPLVPEFTPRLLSVVEAPDAPPRQWSTPRPEGAHGSIEEHALESAGLESPRRIWTYTPAGGHPGDHGACPLLLVFDGWDAIHAAELPVVLDNLIAAGAIPPVVAVLIDAGTVEMRHRDLDCHEPFLHFLTDDVLPFATERWGLVPERSQTVVAGMSLGGKAAVFAALRRPDLFGKVVAQSTAVVVESDGSSVPRFAEDDSGPDPLGACATRPVEQPSERLELYLDAGLLEVGPSGGLGFLPGVRHLRDVLRAAGHRVHYAELPCGHDDCLIGDGFANGLQAVLGGGA